ncbi:hypothetical protein J6590_030923 [Homalodisca vitripennis]|nr:hypothetical protein J6590_030923 [Homalodisca vitripennis]
MKSPSCRAASPHLDVAVCRPPTYKVKGRIIKLQEGNEASRAVLTESSRCYLWTGNTGLGQEHTQISRRAAQVEALNYPLEAGVIASQPHGRLALWFSLHYRRLMGPLQIRVPTFRVTFSLGLRPTSPRLRPTDPVAIVDLTSCLPYQSWCNVHVYGPQRTAPVSRPGPRARVQPRGTDRPADKGKRTGDVYTTLSSIIYPLLRSS